MHRHPSLAGSISPHRAETPVMVTFRGELEPASARLELEPPLLLQRVPLLFAYVFAGGVPHRDNDEAQNQGKEGEFEIFQRAFQLRFDGAVADPADRHSEETPKGVPRGAGELNHPSFLKALVAVVPSSRGAKRFGLAFSVVPARTPPRTGSVTGCGQTKRVMGCPQGVRRTP